MSPAGLFDRYYFVLMSFLSSDNGWTDRNAQCCVNTVDEKNTKATNLVNFGPVTLVILWLICMGGYKMLCALFLKVIR